MLCFMNKLLNGFNDGLHRSSGVGGEDPYEYNYTKYQPNMNLTHNQKYSATIKLGFFEKLAGNNTIKQKLVDAGFIDVSVTGEGSTRTAIGTWPGETREVDLPSQVSSIKLI